MHDFVIDAVYRVGDDEITVGPGHCAHTMWKMHNSPDAPDAFRLLISLLSPVDSHRQIQRLMDGRLSCYTA